LLIRTVQRVSSGIVTGLRARPRTFLILAAMVFALHVAVPPLILSIARKPVDFFTFNPWLKRLPEYLVSAPHSVGRKLEAVLNLALFWFSASNPYGVEWGFAVDVKDLLRFLATAGIIGAYFALWSHHRERQAACGWMARTGPRGGVVGAMAGVLGLSTGPCSVMGCGAPVIPVVGLAFAGLSSTTLHLLKEVSTFATAAVMVAMLLGLAYLGWSVGAGPRAMRANPDTRA
jgi:hypothetical protein